MQISPIIPTDFADKAFGRTPRTVSETPSPAARSKEEQAAVDAARFSVAHHSGISRAERRARKKAGYNVGPSRNTSFERES